MKYYKEFDNAFSLIVALREKYEQFDYENFDESQYEVNQYILYNKNIPLLNWLTSAEGINEIDIHFYLNFLYLNWFTEKESITFRDTIDTLTPRSLDRVYYYQKFFSKNSPLLNQDLITLNDRIVLPMGMRTELCLSQLSIDTLQGMQIVMPGQVFDLQKNIDSE